MVVLAGCDVFLGAGLGERPMTDGVRGQAATVAIARTSLSEARTSLDDAVRSLSHGDNGTVMATANLVGLLGRVVAAMRHLDDLERLDGFLPGRSA